MDVPARRLFTAVIIYIFGVLAVAFTSYWLERERYLEDIDARLYAAANNLPSVLPQNFHDIARTPTAISAEQDRHNLELLTSHARSADMTYIYSYVMVDGDIYFTSCNYTEEDIKNNRVVTYWTDYPEGDKKYFDAMTASEPVYVTAGDRWGLFRTILLPLKSPGGLPYVAAADMDITVIEQALIDDLLAVLGLAALLFFIVIPLVWVYHRTSAEMNSELRNLNGKLQQDIHQAKILENELKQATQKAETANKVKSQFLSNMSHELRTPINGIIGMNQLLHHTELNAEQREYVDLSDHSAQILLDTVNQILDTAAIEANGLVLRPEETDIGQFFDEVSVMFSSQLAVKKLDLVIHIDDCVPAFLVIDSVRVRQVFINLIANAIKFTAEGGINVSVSWQDGVLKARVEDSGIGIPEEAQHEIFEIFNQLDNTHSRQHDGSGLGLSIAQKICELMDGHLRLLRSDKSGSLFSFELAAPAQGNGVIEPLRLKSNQNIACWLCTPLLKQWIVKELCQDHPCLFLSSVNDASHQIGDYGTLLVDADVGIERLQQLLQLKSENCSIIVLLWAGQQLPDAIAEQVTILRKPLTRKSLAQVFSHTPAGGAW